MSSPKRFADLIASAQAWLDAFDDLPQPDYSDEAEVIEALEAYQTDEDYNDEEDDDV